VKYDISYYKNCEKLVLDFYIKKPEMINHFCVTSSIPLIVAYYYINKNIGECGEELNRLLNFYNYDGVEDNEKN
jgi:hypothetical protein